MKSIKIGPEARNYFYDLLLTKNLFPSFYTLFFGLRLRAALCIIEYVKPIALKSKINPEIRILHVVNTIQSCAKETDQAIP